MKLSVLSLLGLVLVTSGVWAQPAGAGGQIGGGRSNPTANEKPLDQSKRGTSLPEGLRFVDHTGEEREFLSLFDGELPVILTLNYERCPLLCSLMLEGLVDAIDSKNFLMPGQEFRLVTLSIDPEESWQTARDQRKRYLELLGRGDVGTGWTFLTGDRRSIDAVTKACGYNVIFDEQSQEYLHPAAVMVCTPDGVISRYLVGTTHRTQTLRLAIVEAAKGKVGNVADVLAYWCFAFDPEAGKYTLVAMRVMKLGGALVLGALAIFLFVWWRRDIARSRHQAASAA